MSRTFGCIRQREKVGVLIAQLGTPAAPTAKALRPYLRQFLGDPRVIEKNKVLWWIILNLFILPKRPAKSAELYKRIWTNDGSPLLTITRDQTTGLQERIDPSASNVVVEFGMRYGEPSIESAIDSLIDRHDCSRILLIPMYPQYSAATTASTYDVFFKHILKRRSVPTVKVMEPFYRDKRYIDALSRSINESLSTIDWSPEKLFLSYHGIPLEYRDAGDPYCCHCTETTQALLPKLNFDSDNVVQVFQSRFGKDPWLTPYTDETVEEQTSAGMKSMAIACPGFTTDCLETIDEMGNELLEVFEEEGGEQFHLIPCLNASDYWLDTMKVMVEDEISSWLYSNSADSCSFVCPVDGRCSE